METPGDQYRIESELPSSPKLVLQFLRYTKIADNPTQPIPNPYPTQPTLSQSTVIRLQ